MGRTHDYHCSQCHTWVAGWDMDEGADMCCGVPMFYDLNHDGCEGGCPKTIASIHIVSDQSIKITPTELIETARRIEELEKRIDKLEAPPDVEDFGPFFGMKRTCEP